MDEDVKALADLIMNKLKPQAESSLTIRWVVIITIFAAICGSLFWGYSANASRLTRLEANEYHATKAVTSLTLSVEELKRGQVRVETLLSEIRYDQQRRNQREIR